MRSDEAKTSWWKRNRPERVVADPGYTGEALAYPHYYVPTWNKHPLPDPGAEAYVYEGLVKQPESVYGRGGIPFTPPRLTQQPMVALPTANPIVMGITFGSFYSQPLYDPSQGLPT